MKHKMSSKITNIKQPINKSSPVNRPAGNIIIRNRAQAIKMASKSPAQLNCNNNEEKIVEKSFSTGKTKFTYKTIDCQTDIRFSTISMTHELLNNQWLTDETVQKYLNLMSEKLLGNKPCTIINPLIVHAVKSIQDFYHFLDPLFLKNKECIIMPLNDCQNLSQEGGSHWSTLVYERQGQEFYHYDSKGNYNLPVARVVAAKLLFYLTGKNITPTVKQIKGPRQSSYNGVDCGIYMLYCIELVVLNILSKTYPNVAAFEDYVITETDLMVKRSTVAYILSNLIHINCEMLLALIKIKNYTQIQTTNLETKKRYKVLSDLQVNEKEISNEDITQIKNTQTTKKVQRDIDTKRKYQTESVTHSRILLMADSQGRQLPVHLNNQIDQEVSVFGHIQPGAPIEIIMKSALEEIKLKKYSTNDFVVVIGGTNNIVNNSFKQKQLNKQKMTEFIGSNIKMFNKTNLILATIPYRYDLKEEDQQNKHIKEINTEIRKMVYNLNLVNNGSKTLLLDLHLLQRRHHTNQGFHINNSGKKWIAKELKQLLQNSKSVSSNVAPVKHTTNSKPSLHSNEGMKIANKMEQRSNKEREALESPIADISDPHWALSVDQHTRPDVTLPRENENPNLCETSNSMRLNCTSGLPTTPLNKRESTSSTLRTSHCEEASTVNDLATSQGPVASSQTPEVNDSCLTPAATPESLFRGFKTPESEGRDLDLLQYVINKEMNSPYVNNRIKDKTNYFLRKHVKKHKKI